MSLSYGDVLEILMSLFGLTKNGEVLTSALPGPDFSKIL